MKKLLSIIFTVILSASVLAVAGCSDGGVPAPQSPKEIGVHAGVQRKGQDYYDYNGTTQIYRLKAGEEYTLYIADDYKNSYIEGENLKAENGLEAEHEYFSQLIYFPEEVEITLTEEADYHMEYTLKGLKKGSAIIQYEMYYELNYGGESSLTHFIDPIIRIIFE